MPGSFFDSNVILYVATGGHKSDRAKALLSLGGTITVQVLNECANVLRRKQRWTVPRITTFLMDVRPLLHIEPLTLAIHDRGLRLSECYDFAIYDSFIVAAALQAGCETLWSEDMQHGLLVDDRLRIANPFAA